MRKILIMLCLALGLTGCGKPSTVSEDVYNLGIKAIEVTEQFLSADLTKDEAYEKLDSIEGKLIPDGDYSKDLSVETYLGVLAWSVKTSDDVSKDEGIKKVKDDLDKLKKSLGK